jgi:hypothetical protein
MNTNKTPDDHVYGRRGLEDQERDKTVYRYLLTLTNLELNGTPPRPNETSIAKQWGMEDNRIFIRRVLRSTLHEEYYSTEKPPATPGLTLGKLVNILVALQLYHISKRSKLSEKQVPRILSRADKLKALRLFFQLSVEERDLLKLTVHPSQSLLQQLVEDATDPVRGLESEDISRLYKAFLRQHQLSSKINLYENQILSAQEIEDSIRKIIIRLTIQHFEGLEEGRKTNKVNDLVEKVQREISRIEFQSGIKQAESFLDSFDNEARLRYLTPGFIQRLTKSVVDNEIITDEFPIYIKYFEVERVRPLPLYVKKENQEIGLLNPSLLENDENEDDINGLERQFAYRVKVYFYLKLPDAYQVEFSDITSISRISDYTRLNFYEEVIGIGSPISHIISAINRVLLWDIPALKDYLPIADEILNNDEVIGGTNHGPVWSHSIVRLYKNNDIAAAIKKNTPCDESVETQDIAYGEFCGFDLTEVTAKAALHARLRLIKQTGINPELYLKELCHHIEELNALNQAKQYLSFHPFSLRAMEGELDRTIFSRQYRVRKKNFDFEEREPGKCWSAVAFDAHLEIADANLKEGLYRVAKKYLDAIKPYFEDQYRDLLGNLIFAKYHLCWFRYYYLTDLEDSDFPDRYTAVRAAENELEKAEECLRNRLKKYENLNELPQSNLHPHFHFLSRIYAHRAKVHIFFPTYTRQLDRWNNLLEPIRLLEKARIYAAQDGDSLLYAQWSAYQSWCYLMTAYLSSQYQSVPHDLTRSKCIEWADGLIKHALICYSSIGKTCYQQIKDNGGKTTSHLYPEHQAQQSGINGASEQIRAVKMNKYYEAYGNTLVQVIPLIQEWNQSSQQAYDRSSHVINLDVSILKAIGKDDVNSKYLFGMHSSIILFAMGMLEICQEQENSKALVAAIQTKAIRMFTYCWAISSDGTQRRNTEKIENIGKDTIILDRAFNQDSESGDYLLQGLYPHRLTQFADLGKIFVAVCKLLLIVASEPMQTYYGTKQSWAGVQHSIEPKLQEIFQLIAELRENDQFPTPEIVGQKRYNGHLVEHYKNLEIYIKKFVACLQFRQLKSVDMIEVRNKILTDVFRIISGEVNVIP